MLFHNYIVENELEKKNIKVIRDFIKKNKSPKELYDFLIKTQHQPMLRITKILMKMEKDIPLNFLKQFNTIHQKEKGIEGKY